MPSHHFYIFDNESGRLLNDIPMKVDIGSKDYTLKTNQDGAVVLNDTWNFQSARNSAESYSSVKALAQTGDSISSYKNDYVTKPTFQHLKFVVELDRPIYRPGQKVSVKTIILKRVPFGYRALKNTSVKVKIMNPQYEMVMEKSIVTNSQGGIHWDYDLPMSGMLGHYTIQIETLDPEIPNNGYTTNHSDSFRVEEYKRPDYFVEVEKSKSPWVLDREVTIKISSKYYYGAPVKKGKISYSITSQHYYPWYYFDEYQVDSPNLVNGEGVLSDTGEFTISYLPKSNGAESRQFTVKVSVFDESGRSIDGFGTFRASSKDFFINAMAVKDFFKNKDKPNFTVKLEDPNGATFSAPVEYEVFELKPPNDEEKKKLKKEYEQNSYLFSGRYGGKFNFQKLFENLPAASLSKGTWDVTKEKSEFGISALPEGVYKIKMHAKDSSKKDVDSVVYFIVAEAGKKLSTFYIPEITLLSKPEYKIGETMTVLFGSSEYSGNMVGFLLKHQLKIDNPIFRTTHGIKVYDFKVTDAMFNGSSFTWFSVFDNQIVNGRQLVNVNNDYKKLDIQFDKTSKIKPGQNSQLKILSKSKLVGLEAMVTMYDQSLEFYAKREHNFFSEIYQNSDSSTEAGIQHEYLQNLELEWIHPDLKSMLEKFKKNVKLRYRPVLLMDSERLQRENDDALELESQLGSSSSPSKSKKN